MSQQQCLPPPSCVDADHDGYNVSGASCGPIDCNDNDNQTYPGTPILGVQCAKCDPLGSGQSVFDGSYSCPATSCPASGCGAGNCGDHTYGTYPSSVPNSCVAIGQCSNNSCSVSCESDPDSDNYSATCGDCNEADPTVNVGAPDICSINHAVANKDCNESNDGLLNCNNYCDDADGDGYVNNTMWGQWDPLHQLICSWITAGGECDNSDSNVHPNAPELCNGIDDNCNGKTDEGCAAVDKEDALAILNGLSTSDSKSRDELGKGIKELKESLGNRVVGGDKNILWLDSAHIACKHGYKVFDHEKKAVDHLLKVTDPAITGSVATAINAIVGADTKLARIAINEAPLDKYRAKAVENFNKAQAETDYKHKIDDYRKAWKYINKECEKALETSCIEEMAVLSPAGDSVTAIGDEISPKDTVLVDIMGNTVSIDTSCKKCLAVGQKVKDWTITDIVANATMTAVCSK